MLSSHRTVLGVLLLSRASPPSIIRHSGVVFDGEQGRKYAKTVGRIVDATKAGLDEVDSEAVSLCRSPRGGHLQLAQHDDMKFMRIRTKRHELMISPGWFNETCLAARILTYISR